MTFGTPCATATADATTRGGPQHRVIGAPAKDSRPAPRQKPPPLRRGLVPRERLLQRLAATADTPVAALIAPAGSGKTTLLSEWATRDERPFAWVTLQDADNDPARLLDVISLALDGLTGARPEIPDVRPGLPSRSPRAAERRLRRRLENEETGFVLVLDDAHRLHRTEALALLTTIASHLRVGSQLAIGARSDPDLPLGHMRAQRVVAELRMHDLAMTEDEAGRMLAAAGLDLDPRQLTTLIERTEGWPAGLHLAALSIQEESDVDRAVAHFAGDDRLVTDYLRDELLSPLPAERLRFLIRTSVLDELSGSLCDAVLDRTGSAEVLRKMARSNLLLIPLDRNDERYRYHPLLLDGLRGELHRGEPERERGLHRRASAWYAQHHDPDRAIEHALAAEDFERAGDLLWAHLPKSNPTRVQRWLERLPEKDIAAHASLALTAAAHALNSNNGDISESWTNVAARALDRSPSSRSTALKAGVAIMRAAVARDGIRAMRRDATRAYELLNDESPWRAVSCLLDGVARHLAGEPEEARHRLEEGARWAGFANSATTRALCLVQLAMLDGGLRDDSPGIEGGAELERAGLADRPQMALVFAAAADVRTGRGQVDAGRREVKRAQILLAALGDGAASWYQVETRILLARACLRLSDVSRARTLLAEAERFLHHTPDSHVLTELLGDVRAQADAFLASSVHSSSSLTTAELRVLQFLPTHLSLPEIAKRLHVTTNTVKTQAHATYRKLDACSRSEAVDRARAVGLLADEATG
jgi:LuxR family transcriptional regulator, maltose regulon positive regulatory protein